MHPTTFHSHKMTEHSVAGRTLVVFRGSWPASQRIGGCIRRFRTLQHELQTRRHCLQPQLSALRNNLLSGTTLSNVHLYRELCMTASERLQTLTVDNAEYHQRLAALKETHQALAEELATAEAEASAATAAHAHAIARSANHLCQQRTCPGRMKYDRSACLSSSMI
jgi:hypothetical protein